MNPFRSRPGQPSLVERQHQQRVARGLESMAADLAKIQAVSEALIGPEVEKYFPPFRIRKSTVLDTPAGRIIAPRDGIIIGYTKHHGHPLELMYWI